MPIEGLESLLIKFEFSTLLCYGLSIYSIRVNYFDIIIERFTLLFNFVFINCNNTTAILHV